MVLNRSKKNADKYLKNLTRDNAQLIINELFKLPVQSGDLGALAKLPERSTALPREKPLPKDKPLTRWEKFAKVKGIQNKKRERMVYDEDSGEYKPRWGYKGSVGDKDKLDADWLIEVPNNADPMEDQYEKKRADKKGRVEKNTKRQRRNEEEGAAATLAGKKDIKEFKKDELQTAIAASRKSTASLGKFDAKLKNETKMKGVTHQFASNIGDSKAEKSSSMDILKKIVGKGETINAAKAARMASKQEAFANFDMKKKFGKDKRDKKGKGKGKDRK